MDDLEYAQQLLKLLSDYKQAQAIADQRGMSDLVEPQRAVFFAALQFTLFHKKAIQIVADMSRISSRSYLANMLSHLVEQNRIFQHGTVQMYNFHNAAVLYVRVHGGTNGTREYTRSNV